MGMASLGYVCASCCRDMPRDHNPNTDTPWCAACLPLWLKARDERVRTEERERCARMADEYGIDTIAGHEPFTTGTISAAEWDRRYGNVDLAAAIRSGR